MAETFDVVIIGSGPGGYVAAIRAGQLGLKTAIVEKDKRLGGTCLHRGCIPTKSLLWTAELYSHILEAADFGIDLKDPAVNWAQALKHKDKVVTKGAAGIDFLMKKNKVTVVKGHGRIAGKGKVEVDAAEGGAKQTLETKNIIIATGSVPKSLPNVTVDHKRVLNSDSILELRRRSPRASSSSARARWACEFASVFNARAAARRPSSSTCRTCCPSRTRTAPRRSRSTTSAGRSTSSSAPRWRRWRPPPRA